MSVSQCSDGEGERLERLELTDELKY